MTRTYQHILPDLHPVHTKYIVPVSTAIQVTYKPNSETLSNQALRPIGSRPRDQVTVCKAKPENYRRAYDDVLYPVYLDHVSGKRGLSRDQVVRFEKRFYSPEPAIVIKNRTHPRYLHEKETRLPLPEYIKPQLYRTVAVRPGPEYAPFPRSHNYHNRPRVYQSGGFYAP
ncbi:hypothetical protein OIDMADRAFT_31759 [Oidiodendron maius Zn]|uniref:Uncharacterized protein n=1 Tax=Oidiodendron maius (strain Zn) TaxID=913774 RepID=A0A0C3H369_OIDMZ|nr:hypothetical protein OIDMADRAFT_31759 [Oidiodendron maius Zn]